MILNHPIRFTIVMDINDIKEDYEYLVPSKDEGLVVFMLNEKIEKKEIGKEFTYQDIQDIIRIVSNLIDPAHQRQTERILRNLMHFFIERPPDKPTRFVLSNYANKFIGLINKKLDHPYRKFPLRDSFKRYSTFKANEITTIEGFLSWYEQGFNATTRETIAEHLEALKDEAESAIQKMNKILYAETLTGMELVMQFTDIFKGFGEKADQITDTLQLGSSLELEVKKVVDYFYSKIDEVKHPENAKEEEEYRKLMKDFYDADRIQDEVTSFFTLVDMRLGQIREKIVFANSKLKELQDNFRYQSQYKINFKRLLQLVLERSSYSKDGPVLPKGFPLKILPFENYNFFYAPKYDFNTTNVNPVYEVEFDTQYEQAERAKIDKELDRQAVVVRLVEQCKELLEQEKELNITQQFYKILNSERDIELSLQVGFELIQYASTNKNYAINVKQELPDDFQNNEVIIWKMNIKNRNKKDMHS